MHRRTLLPPFLPRPCRCRHVPSRHAPLAPRAARLPPTPPSQCWSSAPVFHMSREGRSAVVCWCLLRPSCAICPTFYPQPFPCPAPSLALSPPPAAPPSSSRPLWASCPPGRAAGSCTPPPQRRQAAGRRHSAAGRWGGRTCGRVDEVGFKCCSRCMHRAAPASCQLHCASTPAHRSALLSFSPPRSSLQRSRACARHLTTAHHSTQDQTWLTDAAARRAEQTHPRSAPHPAAAARRPMPAACHSKQASLPPPAPTRSS